jgi:hypothetical protein
MSWFSVPLPPNALRAEIFMLGNRHRGEPLAGALLELAEAGISSERRRLLEAVVRKLNAES